MKRGRGRRRRLKGKGPRKINTIAPYSEKICERYITSN
jgi:hypothetical protein